MNSESSVVALRVSKGQLTLEARNWPCLFQAWDAELLNGFCKSADSSVAVLYELFQYFFVVCLSCIRHGINSEAILLP